MAAGSLVTRNFEYFTKMKSNRIVCGLLHIIVRNDMNTDDAVEEYYNHWSSGSAPTGNAKNSHPFNNSIPATDPSRGTLGHSIGDYDTFLFFVTLAGHQATHQLNGTALTGTHTGSNDSAFLVQSGFTFVTNGLSDADLFVTNVTDHNSYAKITSNTGTNVVGSLSNGTDNNWDNGDTYLITQTALGSTLYNAAPTHKSCQSFVRYQLLGRHNNAYGHDSNNYIHYGQKVQEFGVTRNQGEENVPLNNEQYDSNGDGVPDSTNRYIRNTGIINSNATNFTATLNSGSANQLSTSNMNTYFSPVHAVEVYGKHGIDYVTHGSGDIISGQTHYAFTSHSTTFYNVVIRISLHAFDKSGDDVAFFRDSINVFFQPFGETTEVEFSATEFTS